MRRAVLVGVLVIGLIVGLPFAGFLTARNATDATCATDSGVSQPLTGPVPDVAGLSASQVRLAQMIWSRAHALAGRLGGPIDQAAVIAIAVASQESTLGANPSISRPNGDGDAGPFQQRTLPGWYGTLAQVTDPTYAADTFLLGHTVTAGQVREAEAAGIRPAGPTGYHIPGLADVRGWADLDIVDSAGRVQRSAFPDAVADDIPVARTLVAKFSAGGGGDQAGAAAALTTSSGVGCTGAPPGAVGQCPPSGSPAEARIKPDTLLVLRCVAQQFPMITTFYGYRDHDPFPDHPSGRAVDIMISSAFPDADSPEAVAYGHQIAVWVKTHHAELGVEYVIYRQHIWNVTRDAEGWRPMADRGNPTANHKDHVHVTTYGDAAQPTDQPIEFAAGQAVTPVEHYTISAKFGQVGSWARYHTGLDFAAPIGTPVRASLTGVVTHAGPGSAAVWAGNYISIHHPDGISTLYAHLSTVDVREGQVVTTAQQIGTIGLTGRSFGPHLHLEVYPPGVEAGDVYRATDPAEWLQRDLVGLEGWGSARRDLANQPP